MDFEKLHEVKNEILGKKNGVFDSCFVGTLCMSRASMCFFYITNKFLCEQFRCKVHVLTQNGHSRIPNNPPPVGIDYFYFVLVSGQ